MIKKQATWVFIILIIPLIAESQDLESALEIDLRSQVQAREIIQDTLRPQCIEAIQEWLQEEAYEDPDAMANRMSLLLMDLEIGRMKGAELWETFVLGRYKETFPTGFIDIRACYFETMANYLGWCILFGYNSAKFNDSGLIISKIWMQEPYGPCTTISEVASLIDLNSRILLLGNFAPDETFGRRLAMDRCNDIKSILLVEGIREYQILIRTTEESLRITDDEYSLLALEPYDSNAFPLERIEHFDEVQRFKGDRVQRSVFVFVF